MYRNLYYNMCVYYYINFRDSDDDYSDDFDSESSEDGK